MIRIKVHTPIASQDEQMFYSMFGIDDAVFSLEVCQKIFENNPDEKDFTFDIHCNGGSVPEGLAIYDFLRTSGKNIHMNIEGSCHSMAVILLLAAPKENRTANPNCRAMIHKVSGCAYGGTADELEEAARSIRQYQDSILDIYAERTDLPREELATIMDEEKERTAQELLQWGFISKINTYNTNLKLMTNLKNLKEKATSFLASIKDVLDTAATNYEFVDGGGEVLFTTEQEDDTLEVGMAATPDGTFVIADGREVTIAEGVITEIKEPAPEPAPENPEEENQRLREENANLRKQLGEAGNLINEFKKNIKSDYTVGNRVGSVAQGKGENKGVLTSEERKNAVKEKLHN